MVREVLLIGETHAVCKIKNSDVEYIEIKIRGDTYRVVDVEKTNPERLEIFYKQLGEMNDLFDKEIELIKEFGGKKIIFERPRTKELLDMVNNVNLRKDYTAFRMPPLYNTPEDEKRRLKRIKEIFEGTIPRKDKPWFIKNGNVSQVCMNLYSRPPIPFIWHVPHWRMLRDSGIHNIDVMDDPDLHFEQECLVLAYDIAKEIYRRYIIDVPFNRIKKKLYRKIVSCSHKRNKKMTSVLNEILEDKSVIITGLKHVISDDKYALKNLEKHIPDVKLKTRYCVA